MPWLFIFLLGLGGCSSCDTELVGDAAFEAAEDLPAQDHGMDPDMEIPEDPDAHDHTQDEIEPEPDAIEDVEVDHTPDLENWVLTLGESRLDSPAALLPADDGGVIAAGWVYAPLAGNVFYLVELDASGSIVRQRAFKPEGTCEITDLVYAPDGGLIAAGRLYVDDTLHWDAWILRLDPAWNVVWQKALGGDRPDSVRAVAYLDDGSIAAAGYTRSFGQGQDDLWVFLLSEHGEVLWQNCMGGESGDAANALVVSLGGDIVVLGETASFGLGSYDMWLVSLDRTGSVNWQETMGGEFAEFGNALIAPAPGTLIAAGSALSSRGAFYDVLVMELDAEGAVVWQKILPVDETDVAAALAPRVGREGFIVAGRTTSLGLGSGDLWVIGMDGAGNPDWQRTFGSEGMESAVDVIWTVDEAVFVAGVTNGLGESAALDWVLARLDSDGGFDGSCSLTAESAAATVETESIAQESFATLEETSAAIRDTHAEVWDYSASPVFHCPQ
jgi:hypothetical protein